MTLLWWGINKIGPNHEKSVPCGSLSHFVVLDRFGGLIIKGSALFSVFNQKKNVGEDTTSNGSLEPNLYGT